MHLNANKENFMSSRSTGIFAITLTLASAIGNSFGGSAEALTIPPAPEVSAWEFRTSMYGWLTAMEGTTGVGPLTSDVDVSFGDLFDHLEMAAALQFEARNGPWGIILDGFYAKVGASGNPPGPFYDHVDIESEQFLGEAYAAYRFFEKPEQGFADLYTGVRYNSLTMDFEGTKNGPGKLLPTEISAEKDWLDPIVGVRAQWYLSDKVYLAGKSDVGGFSVGSDLAWSVQGTVGYQFTKSVSSEIGYRYMSTDYTDGAFTYDINLRGIYTSLNIKF
jgi:hypothetical protein